MHKIWQDRAWEEYQAWQSEDKKTLKKINDLLKSIERDGPMSAEGRPERLRGDLSGLMSRRIDAKNRLIHFVSEAGIEIVACRGHYGDR